jgi:molecular chaperone DnaJ
MNRAEALKTLDLKDSATDDEIKKKFRKLAFDKHPDRNKEPNAEEEYKKISAAFEYLKNPPPARPQPRGNGPGGGFHNIHDFMNYHARSIYRPKPINLSVSLTFEESVLGCKKTLEFERDAPCVKCRGLCNDPCGVCGGAGFSETVTQRGPITIQNRTACQVCQGLGHAGSTCGECSGKGTKTETMNGDVGVPGGVINGQVIRIARAGNVVISQNAIAQGDVLLTTVVDNDQDMRIKGRDVISTIELSLCEALQGIKKKVRTVKGEMTLKIRKGSRHKDQLKISGYGVEGVGSHIFTIEVRYPKDTDKLIEFLENNKE